MILFAAKTKLYIVRTAIANVFLVLLWSLQHVWAAWAQVLYLTSLFLFTALGSLSIFVQENSYDLCGRLFALNQYNNKAVWTLFWLHICSMNIALLWILILFFQLLFCKDIIVTLLLRLHQRNLSWIYASAIWKIKEKCRALLQIRNKF